MNFERKACGYIHRYITGWTFSSSFEQNPVITKNRCRLETVCEVTGQKLPFFVHLRKSSFVCSAFVVVVVAFFLKNGRFAGNLSRVARWFVFKPKIPIWVNFGGP
jgi:hypothetical protein